MGESKRKKILLSQSQSNLEDACKKISESLIKLATAASANLGSDCHLHAAIGRELLRDVGINTQIKIGFAAWRVGNGDGDVISHTNREKSFAPIGVGGVCLPFHAWLDFGDVLIDFTTYQLREKAKSLDAMDGGCTDVQWCPSYLLINKKNLYSYKEVAQKNAGIAYYEPDETLQQKVGSSFVLDEEDVNMARFIMTHEPTYVVGHNQMNSLLAVTS